MDDNSFEKFPGEVINEERVVPEDQDFAKAFEGYDEEQNEASAENKEERDETVADAASLVGYLGNSALEKLGPDGAMEAIYSFDVDRSDDPIGDLVNRLGLEYPRAEEKEKTSSGEIELEDSPNAPTAVNKSKEGAVYAIKATQALIGVATTKYSRLNAEAMGSGTGIFGQAANKNAENGMAGGRTRGFAEILQALSKYGGEEEAEKLNNDAEGKLEDEDKLKVAFEKLVEWQKAGEGDVKKLEQMISEGEDAGSGLLGEAVEEGVINAEEAKGLNEAAKEGELSPEITKPNGENEPEEGLNPEILRGN